MFKLLNLICYITAVIAQDYPDYDNNQTQIEEIMENEVLSELTPIKTILGGNITTINSYPFMAILKVDGRFVCGGTIINSGYILTAAHCLERVDMRKMKVHLGTSTLDNPGEVYTVSKFLTYFYNSATLRNDIALLRLQNTIQFNENIAPVKLCSINKHAIVNVISVGWGRTSRYDEVSNELMHVDLQTLPYFQCRKFWGLMYTRKHICTFSPGKEACQGDSGGPLLLDGCQIGLVSYGGSCGDGAPNVYTRISSYWLWFLWNLKK